MSSCSDRWLGVVLMSWATVAVFVAGGLLAWLFLPASRLIISIAMFGLESVGAFVFEEPGYLHLGYATVAALAYGLFRSWYFHPLSNRPYGIWLAQTPWQYPDALPLGPLRLVWQDLAIIAVMVAVAALPPMKWRLVYLVPVAFLISYSAGLSLAHWQRGARWSIGAWLFLAGIAMLLINRPLAAAGTALATAIVCSLAVDPTLRGFPYSDEERRRLALLPGDKPVQPELRWLAAPASLRTGGYNLNFVDALSVGLALGWMMFCLGFHGRHEADASVPLMMLYVYLTLYLVGRRIWSYIQGHLPPISIAGRIATGRLIIPRYDVALVAPIVTALAAYLIPKMLLDLGVVPFLIAPLSTATVVTLILGLPPRFKTWHYNCHFRETVGNVDKKKFVEA